LLDEARERLLAAGIESADREARWLIQHALGLPDSSRLVDRARPLDDQQISKVNAAVSRRAGREPLQYILGTQEFCGLDFDVNPAVLIPRPETELLVHQVIRRLPKGIGATVVDVGTGSGCLAVTLARAVPSARIVATDVSAQALEIAKANARRHGVDAGISWVEGDLLAPLAAVCRKGAVTAIVANPPYISESEWSGLQPEIARYEPRVALLAGARGIEIHERLLEEAIPYLSHGGFLSMEIGQGHSIEILKKIERMPEYEHVEVMPDDAGIDRIVIVERSR
jgi:release factor glutamine methyltransferase